MLFCVSKGEPKWKITQLQTAFTSATSIENLHDANTYLLDRIKDYETNTNWFMRVYSDDYLPALCIRPNVFKCGAPY